MLLLSKATSDQKYVSTSSNCANSIFRLNRVLRTLEHEAGLSDTDPLSKSILLFLGELEEQGRRITVTDVVRSGQFGTAPTVFSRLDELHVGQWIERKTDSNDKRVRLLGLTSKTRRLFKRMSDHAQRMYAK